jgi:hypothetical protein
MGEEKQRGRQKNWLANFPNCQWGSWGSGGILSVWPTIVPGNSRRVCDNLYAYRWAIGLAFMRRPSWSCHAPGGSFSLCFLDSQHILSKSPII